jgi:hypothetical protein
MAHGIWWNRYRRSLGYLIQRWIWRISAGRRHIGCVDVVYVERGILGAVGSGEGGLLPAWRGWVLLAITREKWSMVGDTYSRHLGDIRFESD